MTVSLSNRYTSFGYARNKVRVRVCGRAHSNSFTYRLIPGVMKGVIQSLTQRKEEFTSRDTFKAFGYLYKHRQSHERSAVARSFTSAWSWRFFTIEKDMLKWYKNKDKLDQACGYINFHEVLAIRVLNSECRSKDTFNRDEYGTYSFKVVAQSRELVLRCPRKIHARNWVIALRQSLMLWTGRSGRETLKELAEGRKCRDEQGGEPKQEEAQRRRSSPSKKTQQSQSKARGGKYSPIRSRRVEVPESRFSRHTEDKASPYGYGEVKGA